MKAQSSHVEHKFFRPLQGSLMFKRREHYLRNLPLAGDISVIVEVLTVEIFHFWDWEERAISLHRVTP